MGIDVSMRQLVDLTLSHGPSLVGSVDIEGQVTTEQNSKLCAVALYNNEAHLALVKDWVMKELLKRIANDKHHLHDAEISEEIKTVFSRLFVATADVDGEASDGDDGKSDGGALWESDGESDQELDAYCT